MTTESACPHGMGLPAACVDCMDEGLLPPPPKPPPVTIDQWSFTAQYRGRCAGCDERIEPGMLIRDCSDGLYVHAHCDR